MNMITIFNICSSLVTIPFGGILLYILTKDWRFSAKTSICLGFALLLFTLAVDSIIFAVLEISPVSKKIVIVFSIAMFIFGYFLLSTYHHGRNLFVCLSCITFVLCISATGEVFVPGSTLGRLMYKIFIFAFILFLLIKYMRQPLFELTLEFKGRWHQLSMLPMMLSTLLIIILFPGDLYYNTQQKIMTVMLVLSTVFSYLAIYHLFSTLKRQYAEQTNYAILKEQMLSLEKQTMTMMHSDEQMNIFRHDIRHYINLLRSCLKVQDIPAAEGILDSMSENMISIESSVTQYTGNVLVDAILSDYAEHCAKEQITLSVHLSLTKELENELIDFAIVIANGLENAYHACIKLPQGKDRIICLAGCEQAGNYMFTIENTCGDNILFHTAQHLPVSTGEGHGYGTKSILAFAKKHQGRADFQAERGWFILRAYFPVKV